MVYLWALWDESTLKVGVCVFLSFRYIDIYMIVIIHDDVIKWKHFPCYCAICAGNSPVPGEFPTQRPVRRSFDVFFDLRLNKRLSKQSWGRWFETLSRPLWRHRNDKYILQVRIRHGYRGFYVKHPRQISETQGTCFTEGFFQNCDLANIITWIPNFSSTLTFGYTLVRGRKRKSSWRTSLCFYTT